MKKLSTLLFLFILSLCIGCVETVDISPTLKKQVVLNCLLTNSSIQTARLTYVGSFASTSYEEVEQATVTLYEEGEKVGYFTKKEYAQWELPYKPKPGKEYTLEAEVPGEPMISASTSFPAPLRVKPLRERDVDGRRYFEKEGATDPFWVFAMRNPKWEYKQRPIIEPYYTLIDDVGTNYQSVDPFNQISSAYTNGATTRLHLAYLRMLPNERMNVFYVEKWLFECVVVFRSVSPEYDQYLKSSLAKMLVYESFDDPTQWLDESEIYSNIQNGIGIFGAYNDRVVPYDKE